VVVAEHPPAGSERLFLQLVGAVDVAKGAASAGKIVH
jgi:hypothetical protein